MPRPARNLISGHYYHIMTRGNNCHRIFHDLLDYQYYLELLSRYQRQFPFKLFHYCLMPNHTHFLIQINDPGEFTTMMKGLNLAYYHYYNRRYKWVGYFWQGRYKSQLVSYDRYFVHCGKYIELNPVRARLTLEPQDYLYSSYRYYFRPQDVPDWATSLVTLDPFYLSLGQNQVDRTEAYHRLIVDEMIRRNYTAATWSQKGPE